MGECRGVDCLIKLFGKTIPVPECAAGDGDKDLQHSGTSTESKGHDEVLPDSVAKTDHPLPPSEVDKEDASMKNSSPEEQSADMSNQKEKLKKPDKILPCPRCNSMDTKFCYYNNYNINQPRHFCKNCQRYWTAGGAMRNVPVGAGRRKNKNSAASHFLQRVRAAGAMEPLGPAIKTNGTVLSFGSDKLLCESMASSLDLTEHMAGNCGWNGFHLPEKVIPIGRAGNTDDQSIGSCVEGLNNKEEKNQSSIKEKVTAQKSANPVQHPCMNGGTMWPYSCAATPAYYTSSIAIPFYPAAAYWGCMVPGSWSIPWPPQSQPASSPDAASSVSSGSNPLTLGKHSREGDVHKSNGSVEEGGNGNLWVPKTLRIDDLEEVAKSSIWTMIGIKGDKADGAASGRKLARIFEPMGEAKTAANAVIESLPLLHTNPAALSRSVTFQEGS